MGIGLPPFGFKIVDHPSGKGKALDYDADAQRILHDAASRLLAGGSLTGIVTGFNKTGVLSPRDFHAARSGRPIKGSKWTVDNLRLILSNPTTQGFKTINSTRTGKRMAGKPVLDENGEPVMVGPASFDAETWHRIQQELAQRSQEPRKRRHTSNPLLGVAKCGRCGKNMRQRSQTTPKGVTHRYYVCGDSPSGCPSVSVIAADAEEMVEKAFLYSHADRRVKAREWRAGSDHSAELEQTNRTIESLREDRALGLFTTPEDEQMFRQQMAALIAKRESLAMMPVVKAGWIEVETDQTYADVWPTATPEERRKMLIDAGVRLVVHRPNQLDLYEDMTKLLGEGASAEDWRVRYESRTVPAEDPDFAARVKAFQPNRATV